MCGFYLNTASLTKPNWVWSLVVLPFNCHHFFLNMKKVNHWYHCWVSVLATAKGNDRYKATVSVESNDFYLKADGLGVFASDTLESDIISSDDTLVLSEHYVEQFKTCDGVPGNLLERGFSRICVNFVVEEVTK